MWNVIVALSVIVSLSACGGAESEAKKTVLARLKDPDSAKFGKFTMISNSACLGVNSKNSMGGYVGERQAILIKLDNEWRVVELAKLSHDNCILVLKGSDEN